MRGIQNSAWKVLAVLILIGIIAAGIISLQRAHVESSASTVENVYDYYNIIDNAAVEKKSPDALFDMYRKSGVTSVAVYDETMEKLVNHDFLRAYRGSDFAFRNPGVEGISYNKIYIQPVMNEKGKAFFNEAKEHLALIMDKDDVRSMTVNGVETLEVDAVYNQFMTMPLGVFQQSVKDASTHGMYVVLRPNNQAHVTKAYVDLFLKALDSSDKVSAVIFQGKEVLGYKEYLKYLSGELEKRHIPLALIEAQSQLGFERQSGNVEMATLSNYDVVRLYAMSKDELIKLDPKEAASRFYISDIERNIRMNLFPSYKFPLEGKTLSETNASYIAEVTERLENHGFTVGKASVMDPWFPKNILRSLTMVGALSLVVLTLVLLIPYLKKYVYVLEILGLLVTQGMFWVLHSVLPLQMLALGTAICTPVVVVTLFLNYCVKKKDTAFKDVGWGKLFLESLAVLWCASILSLACAAMVSGLLGDIRFLLEMQIFRGVKVTFLMPVILISIIYIQKFPFFGQVVSSDKDFIRFVKKFCSVQIRLGLLVGLGLLAIVGYVFIGRSGNNGAPVPGFEIALRRFLENLMYARPREKEFLFGHPAVLLSLAALYRKWPQILHYFLILAVTIGQGSMVETFAHMRSPYMLSLIRGLDSLAAGSLSMIAALIAVMILVRITKYFGERYGKV